MNPHEQLCHNPRCWAYGRRGEGHIVIHSRREQRYRCKRCGRTFSATTGTALYRAHKPPAVVATVATLLAHGCPLPAIVAAFGLDERTVARWQAQAGAQCRRVHDHLVAAGAVDLAQVQADEVRVRRVGGVVWLASALAVTSRLWLGGAIRVSRDGGLIRALLERVRACGAWQGLLLCSDGLSSYPTQARRVFRAAVRTGRAGRPRLVMPPGVLLAQVVKRRAKRRVVGGTTRIVRGTAAAVQARLRATQGAATAVVNTAYVERLNATFRARLAPLARRTRVAVHHLATLEAGVWLVGTTYNFCCPQRSLRQVRAAADAPGGKWRSQTPAQAAGLTDHAWTMHELLTFPVPPPRVNHRGRPPQWLVALRPAA
jgi:transposase-like protein